MDPVVSMQGFLEYPMMVPPRFPNIKESLKTEFVSSIFESKVQKRHTKAQGVISAPGRWVLFLIDCCLRIRYVLTDSSFNNFITESKSTCVKSFV